MVEELLRRWFGSLQIPPPSDVSHRLSRLEERVAKFSAELQATQQAQAELKSRVDEWVGVKKTYELH